MNPASAFRRLGPAVAVATIAAIGLSAPTAQAAESPEVQKALDTIKAAHDKYKDPKVAVADGFMPTDECSASPEGVMGYHYVNPKLIEGPVDQAKPPILLYQPSPDGGRTLVAIEYFKPDADQDLSTSDDKPSLFGRGFDGPMEGHSPDMPKHYDLHVWLWQDNPDGVFATWNKKGSCEVAGGQVAEVPAGGAATGGGFPTNSGNDQMWLYVAGGAAIAAGGFVLASNRRPARRQI